MTTSHTTALESAKAKYVSLVNCAYNLLAEKKNKPLNRALARDKFAEARRLASAIATTYNVPLHEIEDLVIWK